MGIAEDFRQTQESIWAAEKFAFINNTLRRSIEIGVFIPQSHVVLREMWKYIPESVIEVELPTGQILTRPNPLQNIEYAVRWTIDDINVRFSLVTSLQSGSMYAWNKLRRKKVK